MLTSRRSPALCRVRGGGRGSVASLQCHSWWHHTVCAHCPPAPTSGAQRGPLCLCGSRGNRSASGAQTGRAGGAARGRKWLAAQVRPCSAGCSGLDPTGHLRAGPGRGQDGRRVAHVLSPHETTARQGVWHGAHTQTLGLTWRCLTHGRQAAPWTPQNCRCRGPQDSMLPGCSEPRCQGPSDTESPQQAHTWARLQGGRQGQPRLPKMAWLLPLVTHRVSGTKPQNRRVQAGGTPSSCWLSLSDVILSPESLKFRLIIQRARPGISLPANRTRAPGRGRGSPGNYLQSVNK